MIYRFDDFRLDPATRELHQGDTVVVLPARALDCLVYLIEHRDRAVGRDELIAAVWGRAEVSETLLSHTIVKLRRALDDTGNEQRTVRTVLRFGYRWVAPTREESDADDDRVHRTSDASMDAPAELAAEPVSSRWHGFPWRAAAIAACLALAWMGMSRTERDAPAVDIAASEGAVAETAGDLHAPLDAQAAAMPAAAPAGALVLPAEVDAPDEWRWLRLGVMDLVAHRLRDGAMVTASSESVVGLLRQRAHISGEVLLRDPALAAAASLRVLPRVQQDAAGQWRVVLEAFGAQQQWRAEAQGDDAIRTARAAADALLRQAGHAAVRAGFERTSPAVDELLQRSGAAMLADQLDQARAVIAAAPAALQQQPEIEQRLAQLDLRSGDYPAVVARLLPLLDRLTHARDDALRARAMMTLAAAHMRQRQSGLAAELYEEAIALRAAHADHEVLGVAHLGRGAVLLQQSRLDEARSELARARIELATIGDSLGVASVDLNLAEIERRRHRPADALAMLKNAVLQFERLGAREGRAYALPQQVRMELELIDGAAALATSDRFWPPEDHTSNLRMRWAMVLSRAQALAAAGRAREARGLIERIHADADPAQDAAVRAHADLLAARLAESRGDTAVALQHLLAGLTSTLCLDQPIDCTRGRLRQLRLLLAEGQVEAAATVADRLQRMALDAADDWQRMAADWAAAEVDRAAGRRQPALDRHATALVAAERIGVPEDLVAVSAASVALLIEVGHLDRARVVGGRIAPWAERDARAAAVQASLFRALGQNDAAERAETAAKRLAGDDIPASPPP